MMEVARTSETSADNYFTRQYIPEDNSELHTRRRENLKSHSVRLFDVAFSFWCNFYARQFYSHNYVCALTKTIDSFIV
jgi:hypothetical protein